jgi:hypothetical protein
MGHQQEPIVEVKTCQEERQAVLGPYLDQLNMLTRGGEMHGDSEIELGIQSLGFDSWEAAILHKALAPPEGESVLEWYSLIAEGVAFQSKYVAEIKTLKDGELIDPEQQVEINSRLMADASIGLALTQELQSVVDSMIGHGEIEEAKKLTAFRNKIRRSVTEIKERIGGAAFEAAHVISDGMAEQVEQPMPSSHRPVALEKEPYTLTDSKDRPDRRVHITRTGDPEAQGHLGMLLLTLGALLLIWGIFILPRVRYEPLPILTSADMPSSLAIASVTARPPSLFIEVESRAWKGMSEQDRRQLVDKVGAAAKAAGYRGARFTTARGQTVASWLEQRGAWLLPENRR